MAFQITVQLRGGKDDIESPEMDQEEAERQLGLIRETLGGPETAELPWLAVQGMDILAALVSKRWEP